MCSSAWNVSKRELNSQIGYIMPSSVRSPTIIALRIHNQRSIHENIIPGRRI